MNADRVRVCALDELPPGSRKVVVHDDVEVLVVNCDGELLALEDRCTHDDGPLGEGELDCAAGTLECPRHGSLFDLRTGRPKTLPAYAPVEVFEVVVEDGDVLVDLD